MRKVIFRKAKIKNKLLFEARKKIGLSIKEICEELGFSNQYYSQIESLRSYPSKEKQNILCQFYNKKLEEKGFAYILFEDEVFPERLRNLTYKLNHIERKSEKYNAPEEKLIPLSYVSERELPIIENQVEREVIRNENMSKLDYILATLPVKQEITVRKYFGIGEKGNTLEEIGKCFGLTREGVRQNLIKGMRKLRHPIKARELRTILNEVIYLENYE